MQDKKPRKTGSGGSRPNSGRKPKNYPHRIWVTAEEKSAIVAARKTKDPT